MMNTSDDVKVSDLRPADEECNLTKELRMTDEERTVWRERMDHLEWSIRRQVKEAMSRGWLSPPVEAWPDLTLWEDPEWDEEERKKPLPSLRTCEERLVMSKVKEFVKRRDNR